MNKGNSLDRLIMSDDLIVAYSYVGENASPDRFPNKDEGFFIESVTCNGMDAEWSNHTWSLTFSNVTGKNITCNFVIDDKYATKYIMSLAKTNTNELRIDEHEATGQQTFNTTEYRYWSKNPNNYVSFNDELWRIIGVFDVDDGSAGINETGTVEKRVKIIRNSSLGNYSWDSSSSGINTGWGINEWSQADIMNLLNNGVYFNRTSGRCYNGQNNANSSCNFTTTGLTDTSKEMIGDAKWYLGSHNTSVITTEEMYNYERSINSPKQCTSGIYCNDSVERTKSWIGKVGLIYPSDFGYAANLETCATGILNSYSSCSATDWLALTQWTISPSTHAGAHAFDILSNNYVNYNSGAANPRAIYPVVYLLPDIKITGGLGTADQPYQLSK